MAHELALSGSNLAMLVVALLAAGWFGETMSPVQLAGCGLIFASLLVHRAQLLRQSLKGFF